MAEPEERRAARSAWVTAGVQAGLCGVVALGLLASAHGATWRTPRSTLEEFRRALVGANPSVLLREERLGLRASVAPLLRQLGEAEYHRVLALYDRAAREGHSRYVALSNRVVRAGLERLEGLEWGARQAVESQSHRDWVLEHGFGALPAAARTLVGDWRALQGSPTEAQLLRVGTSLLTADEQNLLSGRASTDPAVAADPMLQELAARRSALATTRLAELQRQAERSGEAQFRRLAWNEQGRINGASRARWALEQGIAALSPAERALVRGPEAFEEEAAMNTLQLALGVEALSAAERAEVQRVERAAFVAARGAFVRSRGEALLAGLLREGFGRATMVVDAQRVLGLGPRDLLQRERVEVLVHWEGLGEHVEREPTALELRWAARDCEWRVSSVRWTPVPQHTVDPTGVFRPGELPPDLLRAEEPARAEGE